MRKVLVLFFLGTTSLFAQIEWEVITIEKPKNTSYPSEQVEPSIAICPKDTSRIVAGTVLEGYYYSKDGGRTWRSKKIKSKYGVYGDPVLIFDTTGRVYYFHLSNYPKTSWLDRIVCQSSSRICGGFNQGTFPKPNGKVQDKHWAVVDRKTNHIYLTWTQFDAYDSPLKEDSSLIVFSKSTDQGKTWTDPKVISYYSGDCRDDDNTVEGAVPAIGANGEIYVAWAGPKGLVFQCSKDQGKTWFKKEKIIDKIYNGWVIDIPGMNRANGLPVLKTDLSKGKYHGTIYLNWCDQKNGDDDTDVWLIKSTDGGRTWSNRIKVNQDTVKAHQFFTWMSVDQSTGYLYFVYYDRRNSKGSIATDVYLSVSSDGGETFEDFCLTEKAFYPIQGTFFGDYLNIDAAKNKIIAIWPEMMSNGEIKLQVANIYNKESK